MKIVVLDGYCVNPGDLSWAAVEELGELKIYDRTPYDESIIAARISEAEVVVTNKTPITAAVIEECPNIKFITVLATGYNIVDVAAAKAKEIAVSNVPTYGTAAVSQFAISLLLEICAHVGHHSKRVHDGAWNTSKDWCFWDYPMIELAGKTIGILGYGRIGKSTATVAKALGMNVLANSRSKQVGNDEIATFTDIDTLLRNSDVIALHCPLSPETNQIINKKNILKMKDGVIIINNSRGQLVNEQDLADALNSGKVAAAGIDVLSSEPVSNDNPLLKAENCFITPHISWAPKEARQRIIDVTVDNISRFATGNPINIVG